MRRVFALAVLASACGSSTPSQNAVATPPATQVPTPGSATRSVTVVPNSASLTTGQAQSFVAIVAGSSNAKVSWSVMEHAQGGTITQGGVYQAPMLPGIFHVVATNMADTTQWSDAKVTVSGSAFGPFTPTGSMREGRGFHTATLLADGRVLVTGGDGGDNPDCVAGIALAEVYDPSAGSFTLTGNMTEVRYAHTATRLQGGKVLLTGGLGNGGFSMGAGNPPPVIGSAELYDPAQGSFSTTGPMATARVGHTATLLPDGKVLIVGGLERLNDSDGSFPYLGDGVATAELYDPATGAFSPTGSMATRRYAHTATMLADGRVLVAGGISHAVSPSQYMVYSSAELFDPATGAFSPTGTMATSRYAHTATMLADGRVLVAGGADSQHLQSTAELYDPATEAFTPTGRMGLARGLHTATLLHSKVLMTGGESEGLVNPIATAELFDPVSGTFRTTGGYMQTGRAGHTATRLQNGKTLLVGGDEGQDEYWDLAAAADLYE